MELDEERLLRLAIGAFLSSSLKHSEMRAIAKYLSKNPKFCERLASTLDAVSREFVDELVEQPPRMIAAEPIGGPASGVASLLIQAIQRRRYSKDRIASIFVAVTGSKRWANNTQNLSMRELVSMFVDTASDEEISQVLDKLGMSIARDPFLGGIGSRKSK